MSGAGALDFDSHWRRWVLAIWLGVAVLLLWDRWDLIRWFALADTDDNLRMMQVRALVRGQDWFDLRQYRLDPPSGADIHWSRLVDLPIAAIMVVLKPLIGGPDAQRAAAALAPLLPMGVAMASLAAVARRLLGGRAWLLAIALLLCAHSARGMWVPLRIDHHGWQLAMLALVMLGLADSRRGRGGAIVGAASALSLAIGLEMLIYLAIAGAVAVLRWVWDAADAPRLLAYGASLAGGTAIVFLLFASYANRAPVCDALSPVWLSAILAAGGATAALALASPRSWIHRLLTAVAAGLLLAAAFALVWPDCLSRPEGVSAELDRMWLSHVREARPIYRHSIGIVVGSAALPVAGAIGYAAMLWRSRREPGTLAVWASLAVPALVAALLLLWQTRAGPPAQLLAVPGAAALGWLLFAWARGLRWMLAEAAAMVAAFLLVSGLALQWSVSAAQQPVSERMRAVNLANRRCPTLAALRPIALERKGLVLTFVDLGPRLIAVTHHDAIAGPYHRNGDDIVDVMKAFRGSFEDARATIERRGVDYVLICPNMSESTLHRARAPDGFYARLARGEVPDWLEVVPLPEDSPYRMWRVVRR